MKVKLQAPNDLFHGKLFILKKLVLMRMQGKKKNIIKVAQEEEK